MTARILFFKNAWGIEAGHPYAVLRKLDERKARVGASQHTQYNLSRRGDTLQTLRDGR